MDDIQAIYDDEKHAGDIDLSCSVSCWDSMHAFDWEAKVVNTTVDVLRGVQVGLSKDVKTGARLLLIRFVNTQLDHVSPPGGAWYDWKSSQPSVWAIGLRTSELRSIEKVLNTNNALSDDAGRLLIHREPWVETTSWSAEAQWVVEKAALVGIEISVRASQESVAKTRIIRFMTKGHYFRKTSVDDVSSNAGYLTASAYQAAVEANTLPAALDNPPPPLNLATEKAPIRTVHKSQGDSSLEFEIEGATGTTSMYQSRYKKENVFQSLVSPKITILNPSSEDHYIQKVTTYGKFGGEFKEIHDSEHDESKGAYIGAYRGSMQVHGVAHSDVSWQNDGTSYSIPAKSIQHLCVKAVWTVPNAKAFAERPFSMRLHDSFVQPVTIKAIFVDDQNRTKTICWDYADDPLPQRVLNSYADLLENEEEIARLGSSRGVGPDHVCDLWLHMDNPETLKRTYVVVTHKKDSPAEWCVRADDTDGSSFPSSYYSLKRGSFHRMVYDAKRSDSREIDMTSTLCRSKGCKITLLVDLQHSVVYGLTASIQIGSYTLSRSIYLDQTVTEAQE